MPEERHFLAAIRKNPDDRLPRLVYADWLEERGDSRGQLIRIEEELRTAPVYSDRYWQLKPHRRELLPLAPRPWLKKMGYDDGTAYQPVFTDVPAGWKERWRLLREFVERWCRVPMPDVGGPLRPFTSTQNSLEESYRRAVEVALTRRKGKAGLPPSLREWMLFIRDLEIDLPDLNAGSGDSHSFWEEGDRLNFLQGGGGRHHYFIRREDRSEPDPPVWWDWAPPNVGNTARLVAPRLTTMALDFLADQSLPGFCEGRESVKMTKKLIGGLAKAFPVRSEFDGAVIYERDNAFAISMPSLMHGGTPSLVIRSRTQAVQDEVDGMFD